MSKQTLTSKSDSHKEAVPAAPKPQFAAPATKWLGVKQNAKKAAPQPIRQKKP
ncbi:MAG TPA: hypothetical protein VD969_22730 [Symbiobacteriaceae bacterium]|nr:hypothetical protein [Symbiobacteriaceae bacterium]